MMLVQIMNNRGHTCLQSRGSSFAPAGLLLLLLLRAVVGSAGMKGERCLMLLSIYNQHMLPLLLESVRVLWCGFQFFAPVCLIFPSRLLTVAVVVTLTVSVVGWLRWVIIKINVGRTMRCQWGRLQHVDCSPPCEEIPQSWREKNKNVGI